MRSKACKHCGKKTHLKFKDMFCSRSCMLSHEGARVVRVEDMIFRSPQNGRRYSNRSACEITQAIYNGGYQE